MCFFFFNNVLKPVSITSYMLIGPCRCDKSDKKSTQMQPVQ